MRDKELQILRRKLMIMETILHIMSFFSGVLFTMILYQFGVL